MSGVNAGSAARKTPSGLATLTDGAVIGMYLHGLGALFAVIGGAWFVVAALRALLAPRLHGI